MTQAAQMTRTSMLLIVALMAFSLCSVAALAQSPSDGARFGRWSTPINVGPPLNTQYNDMYAELTRDELTVYFTSDRPGGLGLNDLWVSHRASTDAAWDEPENLAVLNSSFDDSLPVLSTSGNVMYFHSTRPNGSCGAGDLWTSRRHPHTGRWATPVNMGCIVNSTSTDTAPAFYANDDLAVTTIYFGSNRPGIGDYDIYETTTTDGDLESAVWTPGLLVPELSSPKRDTRTSVRHDGREIFITSDRDGGLGHIDIWVATREDNSQLWSTPINAGAALNSTADDGSPALSKDGTTLYFFSNRDGGFGGRDIYVTRRTAHERKND
jgi:hypothetical protein